MGKRKYDWSKEKRERFINEGRGKGVGAEYKPWNTVSDFPSKGRVSRIRGIKTGRIHHLLSDLQTKVFYLMDMEDLVIDIRENYPILDLDGISGREDLRFDLFTNKENNEEFVLTTSFLITVSKGHKEVEIAYSVKYSNDLNKKLSLEKLEIERRYWNSKGIDWCIITEKDLPNVKIDNIEWVHSAIIKEDNLISENEGINNLILELIYYLNTKSGKLRILLAQYDSENLLEAGTALLLFKFALGKKILSINWDQPINLDKEFNDLVIAINIDRGNKCVNS